MMGTILMRIGMIGLAVLTMPFAAQAVPTVEIQSGSFYANTQSNDSFADLFGTHNFFLFMQHPGGASPGPEFINGKLVDGGGWNTEGSLAGFGGVDGPSTGFLVFRIAGPDLPVKGGDFWEVFRSFTADGSVQIFDNDNGDNLLVEFLVVGHGTANIKWCPTDGPGCGLPLNLHSSYAFSTPEASTLLLLALPLVLLVVVGRRLALL